MMYCFKEWYGITIPINESQESQYVLNHLISKYKDIYDNCGQELTEFLNYLKYDNDMLIFFDYHVNDAELITIDGALKTLYDDELLILAGDHDIPNLYTTAFASKEDCLNYYKKEFGDILPKNFKYAENLGKLTYITLE